MGTRSLTKVIETWEDKSGKKQRRPITTMYRQFDGYLNGHGLELAEWLNQYTVVNGMRMDETRKIANGIDCLAAQMFAHFKTEAGNIYCMHPDTKDVFEDYLYEIEEVGKDILITVYEMGFEDGGTYLLQATPEELLTKIEKDYA